MIELMAHQQRAVDMYRDKSVLLAHEMGTGKSITSIAIHKEHGAVVVVPPKLRANFVHELGLMGETDYQVIRKGTDEVSDAKWLIIPYSLVAKFADKIPETKTRLICDESHYIKNTSERAKGVLQIAKDAEVVTLLTGTPVMNKPIELWNQLKAIKAGLLQLKPTKTAFAKRYCGQYMRRIRGRMIFFQDGATNIEELSMHLKGDVDIVKKVDVMELPEKHVTEILIELTDEQRSEYRTAWDRYVEWIKQNPDYNEKDVRGVINQKHLVELGKLRQVTSKFKAEYLAEMIESIGEQQAVIFTYYVNTLEQVNNDLVKNKVSYTTLSKPESVETFKAGKCQVFTASIISGAEGLNLQNASLAFIVDEDWVPAKNLQAEDRIHRKGQKNKCTIYYLRCADTIDMYIKSVNERKLQTINKII